MFDSEIVRCGIVGHDLKRWRNAANVAPYTMSGRPIPRDTSAFRPRASKGSPEWAMIGADGVPIRQLDRTSKHLSALKKLQLTASSPIGFFPDFMSSTVSDNSRCQFV